MSRASLPVLIVGGGIAGMCAAVALRRHGVAIELIERDPEWRALGAGLTMNGGMLRAFAQLELLEPILKLGYCSSISRQLNTSAGTELLGDAVREPYGPGIPKMGGIMRPLLHQSLRQAVQASGARVRLGIAAASIAQDGNVAQVRFSDGATADYRFVVAADGFSSTLRARLFPDFTGPRYTGQGCWRAVCARPPEVDAPRMFLGKQMVGVNPVSQTEMYLFLLQNMPAKTWIDQSEWLPRLRAQLTGYDGLIGKLRDELSVDSQINYRPLEAHVLPSPWHRQRTLFIGDAAHATTPHAGFGAGLAVEDALVLGELAAAETDVDRLFERFMARRYARAAAITAATIGLGELQIHHGAPADYSNAVQRVHEMIREPP